MIKSKHGGARKGSGAKPKFNEPAKKVSFLCPISKIDEIKNIIKINLKKVC